MSIQLINQYYTKREKLIQYGGSKNELSVRDAFKDLINHYAEKKHLLLIPELPVVGASVNKRIFLSLITWLCYETAKRIARP